jgi:hypothetical protein
MLVAAALALALAAPDDRLPFPAPRQAVVGDRLKCDYAKVLLVDAEKGLLDATTPAGLVSYRVGAEVPILDREGRPLAGLSRLAPGDPVRVYYLVEEGARAVEIDRE